MENCSRRRAGSSQVVQRQMGTSKFNKTRICIYIFVNCGYVIKQADMLLLEAKEHLLRNNHKNGIKQLR